MDIGFSFGPTWTIHWFEVICEVQREWENENLVLQFDAGCEALVWDSNGKVIQGISYL